MIRHARMRGHGRCSCRASTTRRSRPSSSSTGSSRGRASPVRRLVVSGTSNGCASSRSRPVRSCSDNSAESGRPSIGAGSGTRWTTCRPRRSASRSTGCTATGWPIARRRSSTGAPAAGRASAISRCSRPRDGDVVVGPVPPHRRGHRRARPGGDDHGRHDAPRDHPRRHRRWPCTRRCPRTRGLVGRRVRIPFVDRDVPVIADDVVDPAFGTGAVKITPAHDHDDDATGRRQGWPAITVLADDASIQRRRPLRRPVPRGCPSADRLDLEARGDLASAVAHEMVVGRCQRSDDIVEPRLKTQWFIRTGPLAARALDATRSGRTRIVPARFEKTWEHWLTAALRDWNVSRQLWWGHRIPSLVLLGRARDRVRIGRWPGGVRGLRAARLRARPGPGHLRYLVQLRAVAVLHRLARTDAGSRALLPDLGHGDGLRHHLLLGGPDDDARAAPDRPGTVPHHLPVGARSATPKAKRCRRRRATSSTRSASSTRPAPMPCASRLSTVRRRATTSASRMPSSRTPATSRTSSGTRPASSSAAGPRPSRPTPSGGCPRHTCSARPSAGCSRGRRPRPPPWTRRWPTSRSAR